MKCCSFILILCCLLYAVSLCDGRRRRRQQCNDEALENRGKSASVILTGTVEKVYRRRRSLVYRGTIKVRRVIKGSESFNNQSVIVNGFGNPHICRSDVRPRDTRIFLLSPSDKGRLELNSSLARVTLRNLRKTGLQEVGKSRGKSNLYSYSLFTKNSSSGKKPKPTDVPVKKRPLLNEAPCERKICSYGQICLVDEVTKNAFCTCDIRCSSVFAPVCGTDDITYTNECQLTSASCSQQKHIEIKSTGSCDAADPCANKKCSFHSTCVVGMDGVTPECLCPEKCARYGDNRGSKSVCGTDGVDYPLVCELKRAACNKMKDIQIKYRGLCDPCDGVECPANQVCQLDKNRNHVCRCNGMCSKEHNPVCGSDGKTYTNECLMRVEACKTRKSLRTIYKGECSTRVNPCNSVKCHPGEECKIDRLGIAHCHCPDSCEAVMKPVCGTDLHTYDNECELKRKACIRRSQIFVKYRGICSDSGPCSNYKCGYGATCVAYKGGPKCECPTCSAEFKPVCGTNGITFNNECKLKRESCEKKIEIKPAYNGLCNGCEKKKCDFYSLCESDGNGDAVCICPSQCVKVNSTVCGSDGITYLNECELKVNACKMQQNIKVESRGACDLCKDVHCKFGAKCENGNCVCPMDCPDTYEPLCGSNGVTYINECNLKRTECQMGKEVIVASYGECEEIVVGSANGGSGMASCDDASCDRFGGFCEYDIDGVSKCACKFDCDNSAEVTPVCGSDKVLYKSDCEMKESQCNNQREIYWQPMHVCLGASQKEPCGGLDPIVDELTGKEIYCGEGAGSQPCPSDSYCHKSPYGLFAKCCKSAMTVRNCGDSQYGCCPNMKTPALGPNNAGCPSVCRCNKLGSEDETCDPITRQCPCKPGVGGLHCDRCEAGFWGLPKIADGNSGCIPCGCSLFGSVRDDCEQMTGRCVCKTGVNGMKCNQCATGQILGPKGCRSADLSLPAAKDCSELACYFGASCAQDEYDMQPSCACDMKCSTDKSQRPVCASDGKTYGSECQLKQFSCRYQKDIVVSAFGPCRGRLNPTKRPASRKRGHRKKKAGKSKQSRSKSTRHIQTDNTINSIFHKNSAKARLDTPRNDANFTSKPLYVSSLKGQCSSKRCNHKGLCFNHVNGTYFCSCFKHWAGKNCEKTAAKITTPAFAGDSMIKMRKIRGYKQLIIHLSFRTFAMDGVILYNGQNNDGDGDFLSLAIKDGFVEFRYNLGNGPVIIKSVQKVELNKIHKILAKRYFQDGVLELDGISSIGRSRGTLKGLNLRTDLYIGNIPQSIKKIAENVGVKMGMVGCVQRLKIGRKEINLQYPHSRDIKSASKIGECKDNPCSSMSCKNGATCVGSSEKSYTCMCRQGFTGRRCENTIDACSSSPCSPGSSCTAVPNTDGYICTCPSGRTGKDCNSLIKEMHEVYIPDFNKKSYLQLPRLRRIGRAFKIELWFLARSNNGMLLYNGQHATGQGDFISLNIVDGYLHFRFDLGSGIFNVTSKDSIALNKWHSVKIQRKHRKGLIQVNNGPVVHGKSRGSLTQLNVRQPLFLGGFRGKVSADSGIDEGFNGAIQRLIVNGDVYGDLVDRSRRTHKISRYMGYPCHKSNPCLNSGVCMPELGEFSCKCPMKHMGKFCERLMSDADVQRPVQFDGKSHFRLSTDVSSIQGFQLSDLTKRHKSQKTNSFEITLKTNRTNGLLIWMNKGATIRGDFLAVALRNGFVEFSYNLGRQQDLFLLRSNQKVNDNVWHTLHINRRRRLGTLQIDDNYPVRNVSGAGATQLNTHGYLWLGGSPSLPSELPVEYNNGFEGCIRQIKVDEKNVNLLKVSSSSGSKIKFCS